MRDTGKNGFLLPAEQIIPNAEEVLYSVQTLIKSGISLGYFPVARIQEKKVD